ncbi:MAG TPA: tetratricopeptide repeat protein [Gemmatimonadaceae bacterium]|nr:tetratricopeptide repeat protein [Gemmatimonadaceae bacterium]
MRLPTDRLRDHVPLPAEMNDLLVTARADTAAGCWSDVRTLLADRELEREERPELAVYLAEAEMRLGEPTLARQLLLAAIPSLEHGAADEVLRRATNILGAANFALGEIERAEAAFGRALELAYAAGDLLLVARVMNNLGAIANVRGARERALALYRLSLPAYERLECTVGLAETRHNIAITYRDLRCWAEAEAHERRALALAREAREPRLEQMARVGLAELSLLRGNPAGADGDATRAAVACASTTDPVGEADALRLVGAARAAIGECEGALDVLERAVALARRHGCTLIEAEALHVRAELYDRCGMAGEAARDREAAGELRARLGAGT